MPPHHHHCRCFPLTLTDRRLYLRADQQIPCCWHLPAGHYCQFFFALTDNLTAAAACMRLQPPPGLDERDCEIEQCKVTSWALGPASIAQRGYFVQLTQITVQPAPWSRRSAPGNLRPQCAPSCCHEPTSRSRSRSRRSRSGSGSGSENIPPHFVAHYFLPYGIIHQLLVLERSQASHRQRTTAPYNQ
jgi:hypothetical protein